MCSNMRYARCYKVIYKLKFSQTQREAPLLWSYIWVDISRTSHASAFDGFPWGKLCRAKVEAIYWSSNWLRREFARISVRVINWLDCFSSHLESFLCGHLKRASLGFCKFQLVIFKYFLEIAFTYLSLCSCSLSSFISSRPTWHN